MRLQALNKLDRQQVRPMRLAAVQLDADFAGHSAIDFGVDIQQSVDADIPRKKHLRFALCGCGAGKLFKSQTAAPPRAIAPFFRKVRRGICLFMFVSFQ
jgi:hypothetical protein